MLKKLKTFYIELLNVNKINLIAIKAAEKKHYKKAFSYIRHSQSLRKFSVALDGPTKIKIHHFIVQIKSCIENENLEEHKKNSLYEKLNDFSQEVDKTRTGWQSGMAVYVAICSGIGDGIQKLEPARKWIDSIAQLMGNAKAEEENLSRLLAQKRIESPRKQIAHIPSENSNIDDEIPF